MKAFDEAGRPEAFTEKGNNHSEKYRGYQVAAIAAFLSAGLLPVEGVEVDQVGNVYSKTFVDLAYKIAVNHRWVWRVTGNTEVYDNMMSILQYQDGL